MNKLVTLLNFHEVNIKRYCRCQDHYCVPLDGMLKIFVIPYKKELSNALRNKFKRDMVPKMAEWGLRWSHQMTSYDDVHMVKSNAICKST